MLIIILFILCQIIGFWLVNLAYKLYMKLTGADRMYYNGGKKIMWSFLIGGTIWMFLCGLR